jgi:leukotriene-A4 hydrolase
MNQLSTYLSETEKMLSPFIWESFNLVIMPPAYPYGGMENPMLTYASPSILQGDAYSV